MDFIFGLVLALALAGLALLIGLVIWAAGLSRRVGRLEARLVEAVRAAQADTSAVAAQPDISAPADPDRAGPAGEVAADADAQADAGAEDETAPSRKLPWPALEPALAAAQAVGPTGPVPSADELVAQDKAIVFTSDRITDLGNWIRANWVYVISAVSLALAGVYFVLYGIEKGLLPPSARVLAALGLGLALIVLGEWLRRRYSPGGATAFLPATFAGAGLVSMFAAVLAARQLYGLIGAEAGLAGLLAVAAGAVLLGWFHGPFLTAFGLIGASVAPFVVGGSSDTPYWLYPWFLVIAATGLAVDAMRRWAWISVLALVLGYGGLLFVLSGVGGPGYFGLSLAVLALLTLVLPEMHLAPQQQGPTITETLLRGGKGAWPGFPVRLAGGAVLASSAGLLLLPAGSVADSQMALFCLTGLGLALILWASRAPGLADLAALPVAAFLLRLALEGGARLPLARDFADQAIALRLPESAAPWTMILLLGLAVALSLALAWRSGTEPGRRAFWAAGAALTAPMAAAGLELLWNPRAVTGAYPWALQVMAVAALMAVLAERFARADAGDRRRAAYAVLSCLSLIALALFIVVTKAALTVALAVLLVSAALLDRRFRLPEMGWFIQVGVLVLGWRLLVDPGLGWAVDAPLWEVSLAFLGALAGLAGAWVLLPEERPAPKLLLESGFVSAAALFVNVLLVRWLEGRPAVQDHWAISLNALPWLIVALVQLWRQSLGGWLRWLRLGLAAVAGLLWAAPMAVAVFLTSPLSEGRVQGPVVLDTLMLSYLLPGAVLLAGLRLAPWRWLRWLMAGLGGALAVFYAALEIRRWFQGPVLSHPGVTQGELYAYTVAMMLGAAVLLFRALQTGSPQRRWVAMGLIALTVAKVFLLDAAGLSGLMRVVSFLLLGLALAGVAFLNRWAAAREAPPDAGEDAGS
nr:DUF2339 domain-containing protein [Frigidibacter sp. ROC022]